MPVVQGGGRHEGVPLCIQIVSSCMPNIILYTHKWNTYKYINWKLIAARIIINAGERGGWKKKKKQKVHGQLSRFQAISCGHMIAENVLTPWH